MKVEEHSLNYSAATFIDVVNRGGLSKPFDYAFTLCINSWRVYKEIQSSQEMASQRLLFLQVMDWVTTADGVLLASS